MILFFITNGGIFHWGINIWNPLSHQRMICYLIHLGIRAEEHICICTQSPTFKHISRFCRSPILARNLATISLGIFNIVICCGRTCMAPCATIHIKSDTHSFRSPLSIESSIRIEHSRGRNRCTRSVCLGIPTCKCITHTRISSGWISPN